MSPDADPNYMGKGTLRVTKISRNKHSLSGSVLILKNMGNECVIHLPVYNVIGNNKFLVYTKSAKLCDFLKAETFFYPKVREVSNFPPADTCPLSKGNYTMTNYVFDEDALPDVIPLGKYYALAEIKLEQKTVFGFFIDVEVVRSS